tara:strand:- start:71 stop:412 length:342 start_codon:yes stop_codon:yes gene_type:complete
MEDFNYKKYLAEGRLLELFTVDHNPKEDLINLYLMTYDEKIGEPYFERKYKKFRSDIETHLQPFGVSIEEDHGLSEKALIILVNKKDKRKIKNILTKLSNKHSLESELEIDTL